MADVGRKTGRMRLRAVISLLTAWGFAVMALTGLVLYIEPHGRVAFWTWWTFLGLGKEQWDGIHVISCFVFIIAGAIHLYYNWKTFVRFLGGGAGKGIGSRSALALATVIMLLVVVSGIWHLPPMGYLLDLNEWTKESWVNRPEDNPPFGHAEMHSLSSFTSKMRIDPEAALSELEKQGIIVSSPEETLEVIASNNGVTPAEIYRLIRPPEDRKAMGPTTSGKGKKQGQGSLQFQAVGYVHSSFTPETGAPRQGRLDPDSLATIEIDAEYEEGLIDIETFSHVIVVYVFDRSTGWQPMVRTPWEETLHGVFAVRTPNRPNPIGLTVVQLEKREGRTLFVRGLDAFDGSPVLDIKPFIPVVDCVQDASDGWLEGRMKAPSGP